ncbi:MAG TPA: hypothetical protein VND93_07165, partial [Myxococcales bacterium]|nr:hypothetical protein [Myxococcales bacterium]
MTPTPAPDPAAPSAGDERPRFLRDLDTLVRARYPLVYLVSWEEQRVEALLEQLANSHGKALYTWSVMRGLRKQGGAMPRAMAGEKGDTREPREVLQA